MERTRGKLTRDLDARHFTRGPTAWDESIFGLMATNPRIRWAISGLIFLAIVVPVIVIFWDKLLETFGMAMGPVTAIVIVAIAVAYKYPRSLVFRANRWLSVAAFVALLFGTMAYFRVGDGIVAEATLGGDVGMAIIGDHNALGVMRLIGIGLAMIALFAPAFSWQVARAISLLLMAGAVGFGNRLYAGYLKLSDLREARRARDFIRGLGNAQYSFNRGERTIPYPTSQSRISSEEALGPNIGVMERPDSLQAETDVEEPETARIPPPTEEPKITPTPPPTRDTGSGWQLPSIDLLDTFEEVEQTPAENEKRAAAIEEALASHGIEVKVDQVNSGPTVTQFGVSPGWSHKYKEVKERDREGKIRLDEDGKPIVSLQEVSRKRVKVDQIATLDKDLALALAAPSIRIEAPVPGKSLVGIEVPNSSMGVAGLREVIESQSFQKLEEKTSLALALGKGSAGEVAVASLDKMPHLLIAGATGSGKSVFITSLISCLLMHNTPDDVRLVLIDPKRVELTFFAAIPHLVTPVIVDMDKVLNVLKWLTQELDRRYKLLASLSARDINSYNGKAAPGERLPYLVVVVDELADLMNVVQFDVEQSIQRLAQLGRASGIHLVLATQRPSVNVITGVIKANFPTRISFAVTSNTDSRVILDTVGAEKLLGRGDMLYLPSDASKPKRLQGVFLSEQEVERIVYFWSEQKARLDPVLPLDEIVDSITTEEEERDDDPLLRKAREMAMSHKSLSTSLLQRRLGIGYPRAARLMDQLEDEGVVGAGEPGKSRPVLMSESPQEEEENG